MRRCCAPRCGLQSSAIDTPLCECLPPEDVDRTLGTRPTQAFCDSVVPKCPPRGMTLAGGLEAPQYQRLYEKQSAEIPKSILLPHHEGWTKLSLRFVEVLNRRPASYLLIGARLSPSAGGSNMRRFGKGSGKITTHLRPHPSAISFSPASERSAGHYPSAWLPRCGRAY